MIVQNMLAEASQPLGERLKNLKSRLEEQVRAELTPSPGFFSSSASHLDEEEKQKTISLYIGIRYIYVISKVFNATSKDEKQELFNIIKNAKDKHHKIDAMARIFQHCDENQKQELFNIIKGAQDQGHKINAMSNIFQHCNEVQKEELFNIIGNLRDEYYHKRDAVGKIFQHCDENQKQELFNNIINSNDTYYKIHAAGKIFQHCNEEQKKTLLDSIKGLKLSRYHTLPDITVFNDNEKTTLFVQNILPHSSITRIAHIIVKNDKLSDDKKQSYENLDLSQFLEDPKLNELVQEVQRLHAKNGFTFQLEICFYAVLDFFKKLFSNYHQIEDAKFDAKVTNALLFSDNNENKKSFVELVEAQDKLIQEQVKKV